MLLLLLVVMLFSLVVVEAEVDAVEISPVHAILITAASVSAAPWAHSNRSPSDIKAGRLELMPLTFGFPLFSEAIQVCYPERKLSRRVPPRCPSPKPSSWEGRLRG